MIRKNKVKRKGAVLLFFRKPLKRLTNKKTKEQPAKSAESFSVELFQDLQKNIDNIKKMLGNPGDLVVRKLKIGITDYLCAVICIDGLANNELINDKVIKSIQSERTGSRKQAPHSASSLLELLKMEIISTSEIQTAQTLDEVTLGILSGDTALFIEGLDMALLIGSKGWATRSVEEPTTEALVRGPRDGFIENLRTNTSHIRRRMRDPNLRMESHKVGRRSKKDLIVAYVEGIVNPNLLQEVNRRLKTIDTDDAPESGIIEQWIEDSFLSPFPQIRATERPDKVSSALYQGKVAIMLDGTPFALILPETITDLFQNPEDFYERWQIGSLVRMLRFVAAFFAIFLPSFYIALVSFHPGMIPSKLAFSVAATREGVPFPAFIEALIMEATLELLREAGIRLPKPIGQTIGIVGGLVIGDAAVSAGIVSPIMVIVVALTAISSFALPDYSLAISFRIMRFAIMLAAALFGLYGIILCYIMINVHLSRLQSFGIPYSTPFAPFIKEDYKDLILRAPALMLGKRPKYTQPDDSQRIEKDKEGGKS